MGNNKKLSLNKRLLEDPIVKLEKPHKDNRGCIQPLVDEEMKSAVLISSKKGSVRANHYHKTDWHFCYVLSGSIDYYFRPCGSKDKPKCTTIREGDMFFTPPLVEHTMCFPEDSEFICLGKNSRVQESYEKDVERIALIS